jgi:drug/metabolite transporter (DMT)-like permease
MIAIIAGAVVLSWPAELLFFDSLPVLSVLGACLAWGIDNNLTRKISLSDATWVASIKGVVAGIVNLSLALALGATLPSLINVVGAMIVGLIAYGISLALFVVALRHLGAARTGAYFSIAPFFGAILALIMGEPLTLPLLIAGTLMALGVWLHLTEHHEHKHLHDELEHNHEHTHDEHHQHAHAEPTASNIKHSHHHQHEPQVHTHAHFPDTHHSHRHK